MNQYFGLVQRGHHDLMIYYMISLWYSWKIAHLVVSSNLYVNSSIVDRGSTMSDCMLSKPVYASIILVVYISDYTVTMNSITGLAITRLECDSIWDMDSIPVV